MPLHLARKIYKAVKEPAYAIGVLKKRLGSLLSYWLPFGISSWPETVSLFLTYRCNLACAMCGYWGKCGSLRGKESEVLKQALTLAELKQLIDELKSFKPNITLFGGEPFLYPDWPDLIKYAKQAGLRTNAVSNATLLFGHERELVESGLDEIIFSLEGPGEIHDQITNVKGAFAKAFGAIEQINQLKEAQKLKRPTINIAVTICEDNYKLLFDTFALASKLAPDAVTFHHLSFIDRPSVEKTNELLKKYFGVSTQDWSGFMQASLPAIDSQVLLSQIEKIHSLKSKPAVFFYPDFSPQEIKRYYTDFKFRAKNYSNRCLSPWMTVYIFPDGKVGPCEELNLYFGNIKEKSFKEIWNGASFRRFRRILKSEGCFPVCSRCTELYRF